ncbi:MAG: Na+/H+ antiporter NhaC family protein [Clostridium sp.]|jgi:Na+/H+ antiporter NhaC|nr:Na+/H+ antiporter NhaC family protein [Clostridium sp.]
MRRLFALKRGRKVSTKRRLIGYALALFFLAVPVTVYAATGEEYASPLFATFWALIPPVVAIALALITKEVYSSLFVGILMGALLYANFNPERALLHVFEGGMISVLSNPWNVGILLFLVILGMIVCLINKAGGSAAFGRFAAKHIKSAVGAQLATVLLGCLIFVDDYFNCLTVGSVMRPVTDKHKVSREKLAYIIDATAAPVCIIAPISSWAAAVTGVVEGEDGLTLFVSAIPYNFYALFTLLFMVSIILFKVDFGPMSLKERAARLMSDSETLQANEKKSDGKVLDLVLPIVVLIVSCVLGMVYTGGFFTGTNFVDAFGASDASLGLTLGSVVALIITIIYFLCRKVLSLKTTMECLPEGFRAMVPAILILTFAWTLNEMTSSLGAAEFVEKIVDQSAEGLMNFLPAVVFLIACFLAFATGTSWGTFGILIPIVANVFAHDHTLMVISISACMAGAVCGDHCSPISDTTIMASAGADCNHVDHVSTQLPYAILVAAISFVTYILAGFARSAWICLPVGTFICVGVVLLMRYTKKRLWGQQSQLR